MVFAAWRARPTTEADPSARMSRAPPATPAAARSRDGSRRPRPKASTAERGPPAAGRPAPCCPLRTCCRAGRRRPVRPAHRRRRCDVGRLQHHLPMQPGAGEGAIRHLAVAVSGRGVDERLLDQFRQLARLVRPGQRVFGRNEERHRRGVDLTHAQSGRGIAGQRDEGQVQAAREQPLHESRRSTGGHCEPQCHRRVQPVEASQEPGEVGTDERGERPDVQSALQPSFAQLRRLACGLCGVQGVPGLGEQGGARAGEGDALGGPFEQGRTELPLQ